MAQVYFNIKTSSEANMEQVLVEVDLGYLGLLPLTTESQLLPSNHPYHYKHVCVSCVNMLNTQYSLTLLYTSTLLSTLYITAQ